MNLDGFRFRLQIPSALYPGMVNMDSGFDEYTNQKLFMNFYFHTYIYKSDKVKI